MRHLLLATAFLATAACAHAEEARPVDMCEVEILDTADGLLGRMYVPGYAQPSLWHGPYKGETETVDALLDAFPSC